MPWPAPAILIGHRRREAAFEQSVLDEIGRGPEQFLPGEEAARIRQPALLAWGAHDRVIDPSAMGLYAARIDRKSAVWGKVVAGRYDLGGRRSLKKKKK